MATLFCGLAGSLMSLGFWRFVQGIGAGAFIAAGYALIPMWVARERVGRAYGLQSFGAGVGMVAGVPTGGILSQLLTWHWIFLASVPMLVLLLAMAWHAIPRTSPHTGMARAPMPWHVLVLFSATRAATTVMLNAGPRVGWSSAWVTGASAVAALLSLALAIEGQNGRSLFSPGVMQATTTVPAMVSMTMMAAVVGGIRYILPFYLELGCGLSILASSCALLAYPLGYGPVSLLAGRLSDRFGSRVILLLSVSTSAVLLAAALLLDPAKDTSVAVLFMIFFGAVTGMYFAPANRWIMESVPESLRGEAGGALSVVFNFGTLIGVALFEATLSWREIRNEKVFEVETLQYSSCLAMGVAISILALGCVTLGRHAATTEPRQ